MNRQSVMSHSNAIGDIALTSENLTSLTEFHTSNSKKFKSYSMDHALIHKILVWRKMQDVGCAGAKMSPGKAIIQLRIDEAELQETRTLVDAWVAEACM